ncbi:MAG: thiol:disulfide interchange protein DsbA/DsbL [Rhodoferax sp.]|nr:thiol:disulfide interchange protein DsbA/DsbL [Rhodoferax sp.]
MKRRQFSVQLAATSLGLPFLNTAQAQAVPTEGTEYQKLRNQVPVTPPAGKVEVVEFFSYACPHCADFEPALEAWAKRLPPEIYFRRIPVSFLPNAANFQALYYALEEMRLIDTLQMKVFRAVHQEGQRLATPDEIGAFMAKNGVDAAKFMATFNSFGVKTKVTRGTQLVNAYMVESVPLLAVQGRFQTSPALAKGAEGALRVTNYLVQQVRSGK